MKSIFQIVMLFAVIGFISSCAPKGDKAEVTEAKEVVEVKGTNFTVNSTNSQVLWEGKKPAGKHNGTVNVQSGVISTKDNKIVGGSFILDMNSISCTDLEGGMKASLESHLKGTEEGKEEDFFYVGKFPTAKFEITKVTSVQNDPDANSLVYGNLTLKGVTKQLGFKANVKANDTNIMVTSPQFTINRTDWGINFMSKSVFTDIKDKFINDEIGLSLNISASKS